MGFLDRLFGRKRAAEKEKQSAPAPAAEPAPAPIPEPTPAPAPEPVPAPEPAPVPESIPEPAPAPVPGKKPFGVMRYNRSFTAKLIQTDEAVKGYHAQLERELCSYAVSRRVSWKCETFRFHRRLLVKMAIRRKTLCLYFALSPEDYAGSKYKVEPSGGAKSLAETPCRYRIVNPRRCKYAADLIAEVMARYGAPRRKKEVPLGEIPPFESTEKLIARGLIREVGSPAPAPKEQPKIVPMQEVRAAEVDEVLADETAAALVEQAARYADKTKQGIINIDTIATYFKSGETVTLAEIKKRIPGYNKVTYIKVLARGTLAEPLTVEADEFSIEAVKMIVLTGGKVLRTRR